MLSNESVSVCVCACTAPWIEFPTCLHSFTASPGFMSRRGAWFPPHCWPNSPILDVWHFLRHYLSICVVTWHQRRRRWAPPTFKTPFPRELYRQKLKREICQQVDVKKSSRTEKLWRWMLWVVCCIGDSVVLMMRWIQPAVLWFSATSWEVDDQSQTKQEDGRYI